jgi:hypothetical protein
MITIGITSTMDYENGDTTNDYGDYDGGGSSGGDGGECRVNYGDGGARRRDDSDATGSDDERGAGGSSAARKSPCPAG